MKHAAIVLGVLGLLLSAVAARASDPPKAKDNRAALVRAIDALLDADPPLKGEALRARVREFLGAPLAQILDRDEEDAIRQDNPARHRVAMVHIVRIRSARQALETLVDQNPLNEKLILDYLTGMRGNVRALDRLVAETPR